LPKEGAVIAKIHCGPKPGLIKAEGVEHPPGKRNGFIAVIRKPETAEGMEGGKQENDNQKADSENTCKRKKAFESFHGFRLSPP
jgi:hypothetical protein